VKNNLVMDELIKESILFFKARALNISVNKGRRKNINITDWTENYIIRKKQLFRSFVAGCIIFSFNVSSVTIKLRMLT